MKWFLRFAALAAGFYGLTFAVESHATPRNLRAFCAAHRNYPGLGEDGVADLPRLPGHTWRCENGTVLVCNLGATGRACWQTGPMDARRRRAFERFCREYPGRFIPYSLSTGLASSWTCRGTRPVLQSTIPVDRQGFVRGAWRPLP